MVHTILQATDGQEAGRAFDFWRNVVLPQTDVRAWEDTAVFEARRMVAPTRQATLIHTFSRPVGVERLAHHVRRDTDDSVCIAVLVRGLGYQEQGRRGGLVKPGDFAFATMDRPMVCGSREPYEELRMHMPRDIFQQQIGVAEALAGSGIYADSPIRQMLITYLRTFAGSIGTMSEAEADTAFEAAFVLVRHLVGGPQLREDVSTDAIRSLALARIERHLHDPDLSPGTLCQDLLISRSRLYAAFAGESGVAAIIRDLRLDRAHKLLSAPSSSGVSVAQVMYACGFRDAASFSRAFRRRFDLSPRDLRAARGAPAPQTPRA